MFDYLSFRNAITAQCIWQVFMKSLNGENRGRTFIFKDVGCLFRKGKCRSWLFEKEWRWDYSLNLCRIYSSFWHFFIIMDNFLNLCKRLCWQNNRVRCNRSLTFVYYLTEKFAWPVQYYFHDKHNLPLPKRRKSFWYHMCCRTWIMEFLED